MVNVSYVEIQKAVYTLLNVSAITNILGGSKIYDRYPSGSSIVFPYIILGDHITSHEHGHSSDVFEVLIRVDVWDRDEQNRAGKKRLYELQSLIDDRLNRTKLNVSGANHLYTLGRMQTVLDANDGFTWQGIQTFDVGLVSS